MDIYDIPSDGDDDEFITRPKRSDTASRIQQPAPTPAEGIEREQEEEDLNNQELFPQILTSEKGEPEEVEENSRDRDEDEDGQESAAHKIILPRSPKPTQKPTHEDHDDDDEDENSSIGNNIHEISPSAEQPTSPKPVVVIAIPSPRSHQSQSIIKTPQKRAREDYSAAPAAPGNNNNNNSNSNNVNLNENQNVNVNENGNDNDNDNAGLPGRPVKRVKWDSSPNYQEYQEYQEYQDLLLDQDTASSQPQSHSSSPSSQKQKQQQQQYISQIGLSIWADSEKEALFEALSRLGGGRGGDCGGVHRRAAAISSRIRTKSQFEVAQYLHLLDSKMKEEIMGGHTTIISRAEIPAAVEISQACCDALKETADAFSLQQENYEASVERRRWGDDCWLITRENIARLEREHKQQQVSEAKDQEGEDLLSASPSPSSANKSFGALQLFKVKNWLELSERVFMNPSLFPMENNWNITVASDEEGTAELPGIRAEALEDFYSIAVSLTRRIIAAAVYISGGMTQELDSLRGQLVLKEDIEAAVASLDLGPASHGGRNYECWEQFWANAPRRLGLDVYEGDLPPSSALGENQVDGEEGGDGQMLELMPTSMSYNDVEKDDGEGQQGSKGTSSDVETNYLKETEEDHERELVDNEVDEFVMAARPLAIPTNIRESMRKRIRAARRQERYADQMDRKASAEEERKLWALVGVASACGGGDEDGSFGNLTEVQGEEEEGKDSTMYVLGEGTVEELYEYYCGGEVVF